MASSEDSSLMSLPILTGLIPGGIRPGTDLLVEFDSQSLWYETSLTIAAQALEAMHRTEYHVFERRPTEVLKALEALGVKVRELRQQDTFRVIDSFTVQTAIGAAEEAGKTGLAPRTFATQSVKISDWSIAVGQQIKAGAEADRGLLHIDDNTGVLLQYNDEKVVIDCWRTRIIPHTKMSEAFAIYSLLTGVASPAFYRQFESLCDGVIEFRSEEKGERIDHLARVRILRGRNVDSSWRRIRLLDTGQTAVIAA